MKKLIIGVLILVSSCVSRKARVHNLPRFEDGSGRYFITFDATRRGSLVTVDKSGKLRVLSEVAPDAAVTSVINLTSKLNVKDKFEAEQVTKITESLTQLGKRTASVNILRDALYRLEELHISGEKIDSTDIRYLLFKEILATVKEIQLSEKIEKEVEQLKSELKSIKKMPDYDKK
ncbi:hypothetical protein [Polaribacter porphyrae]|uniref:Uncharacterized protein n=1 Tax=Polaribacter porphyrae TaxID=1137780 RepID=A0A2S7WK04_9FLAO|nr:hypothetical protein [Polaribacter porphyrae]PQJ77938.1 hypothetical protein BTO18_01495 [Polaribacter porphyrae]